MRILALTATTLVCAFAAGPSQAGDGPLGSWRCYFELAVAGTLTVEPSSYEFMPDGATQAGSGAVTIDRNLIHVVSGPLRDRGIALGSYAMVPENAASLTTGDWAGQLAFIIGSGKGMSCNPRYDDESIL